MLRAIDDVSRELEAEFEKASATPKMPQSGVSYDDLSGKLEQGRELTSPEFAPHQNTQSGDGTPNTAAMVAGPGGLLAEMSPGHHAGRHSAKRSGYFLPAAVVAASLLVLLTAIYLAGGYLFSSSENLATQESVTSHAAEEVKTVSVLEFSAQSENANFILRDGKKPLDAKAFRGPNGGLLFRGPVQIFSKKAFPVADEGIYLATLKIRLPAETGKTLPVIAAGVRNLNNKNKVLPKPDNFTAFVHNGRLRQKNLIMDKDNIASITGLISVKADKALESLPDMTKKFNAFIAISPRGAESDIELLSYTISVIAKL